MDHIAVNKKGFSGVTDPDSLSFRIDNDLHRRINVGSRINIDMAVSCSRLDNRNGRLFHDCTNQAFAPARNQNINASACAHHRTCPVPTPGINCLDKVS